MSDEAVIPESQLGVNLSHSRLIAGKLGWEPPLPAAS